MTAMLRASTTAPPGDVDPGARLSVVFDKAAQADGIARHARTRALTAGGTKVPLVMELLTWYQCAMRVCFPAISILRQSPQ